MLRLKRFTRNFSRLHLRLFFYSIIIGCFFVFYIIRPSIVVNKNNENKKFDSSDPFVSYKDLEKIDWHDYQSISHDIERKGPGEGGSAVVVPQDPLTKKEELELYKVNGYNAYASDMISLNRSVRDIRHKECKSMRYLAKLPSVSVIFPFHNEHNSTLLRSVYSVINRSPKEILKEIILVDDSSTKEFLKTPLDDYLKKNHLDHIVRVVHTKKREGLIRARLVGAQHATADIMVFLDAHSEPNYNWLPPLIEPIVLDYRTVVCPFVDIIDCDNFEYRTQDEGARGSFDWFFNYKRLPLTDDDLKHPTRPFRSPVMAGGYFAISTKWFWDLGGYDEGLDIWGGEQYELSFKVWQCHGSLVDAPCSRVGHIYRCKYIPFPNPNVGDFVSRNFKRVAEVWMDEYKEKLFKKKPLLRGTDEGDLTKQKAVRTRHKCKSFDWYMKNIAFDQDHYYPFEEPQDSASGKLRNIGAQKCVKITGKKISMDDCEKDHDNSFILRLTFRLDIRPLLQPNECFDVSVSIRQAPVIIFHCHGMHGNQRFDYKPDLKQIRHPISGQCLDYDPKGNSVYMNPCDTGKKAQQWEWTKINITLINERSLIKGPHFTFKNS